VSGQVKTDGRAIGTLDVESGSPGAFDGASIARYERLALALRPLWTSLRPGGINTP
jgi:putative methionine-R-sulfoxide reductase with GAF domain